MSCSTHFFTFLLQNKSIFILIFNIFLFFIYILPPIPLLLTYIHELGHSIILILYAFITKTKIEYIDFEKPVRKYGFYTSKTKSNIFKQIEENKNYFFIRLCAINGSFFTIFILILISKLLPFLTILCYIYIFFEILNFLCGSSDLKNFLHPELFHYTE